jgi:hypothetical protein
MIWLPTKRRFADGRWELIGLELALWSPCNVTMHFSFKALRDFPVSLAYKSSKREKLPLEFSTVQIV